MGGDTFIFINEEGTAVRAVAMPDGMGIPFHHGGHCAINPLFPHWLACRFNSNEMLALDLEADTAVVLVNYAWLYIIIFGGVPPLSIPLFCSLFFSSILQLLN